MAEAEEEDLDLDVKPASNKKLIIIMAVVGIVLIGASVGITLWLLGSDDKGAPEEEVAAEESLPQAEYLALDTMVVNFAQKGPANFLQVDMQLMAHDSDSLEVAKAHMPAIRNDILLLLGSQTYEEVSTREGKEKLRGEILSTVNRILKQQAGKGKIEAVYFTNFVMQ